MKPYFSSALLFIFLFVSLSSGCTAPAQSIPASPSDTPAPSQTVPPSPSPTVTPSPTQIPSATPTLTDTPLPPTETATPTLVPQPLLLRRKCGRDYTVRAGEPVKMYYGGWAVVGKELANQWITALVIELMIDDQLIDGELQRPTHLLPFNCTNHPADTYWLYSMVLIPGFSAGKHNLTVTFKSRKALTDGSGIRYGPGTLLTQNFTITAQ